MIGSGLRRHPRLLGLRSRLILLLVLAFAVLAVLASWDLLEDRADQIAAAKTRLMAETRLIAIQQESLAHRTDAVLNSLMLVEQQAAMSDPNECSHYLSERLKREPYFSQIALARANGDIACDATGWSTSHRNVADEPYFAQIASASETILARVVISQPLQTPVMVFGKAMRDAEGRLSGALFATLDFDWLRQEFTNASLPDGARVTVMNSLGAIIIRYPDPEHLMGKMAMRSSAVRHILASGGDGALTDVSMTGEPRLYAYTTLFRAAGNGYHLVLSVPREDIDAPLRRTALLASGIMLAVLTGTIVLIGAGTNHLLLRPLSKLSATASRLRAGDLTARAQLPHGNDEIGRLARLLDETAAALEEKDRRITAANQSIERSFAAVKLWADAFKHANVGITIANPASKLPLAVNPAFASAHGLTIEEAEATPLDTFYVEGERSRVRALLAQAEVNGHLMFESRHLRKDGSSFPVQVDIAIVRGDDGEVLYRVDSTRDISERRRIEAALRQAAKMEAVGTLTGGLAHDFNNFLGVIVLNLDVAEAMFDAGDPIRKLVADSLAAARAGADLIRALLAFARRQPLSPLRIDVNQQVTVMHSLLACTLGADIEIVLDRAADLWPVIADPSRIEACLLSLATNARDAMPHGGRLTIATANQTLDVDYAKLNPPLVAGDYVTISVSDTGVGMAPEVVAKVFEPFFTTKEPGKGTGLGLSMVFGFATQSGGHVSVHSEPGVGTTFRLYLPRAPMAKGASGPTASTGRPELARGRGESVLVVEDNDVMRQSLIRQLGLLNYHTIETESADAALAVLERRKVDLLLSDVVMPGGIDGFELADRVRTRWPTMKVVLTSGFSGTRKSRLSDGQCPPPRVLGKPFDLGQVARTLREVLDA